MVYDALAFNAHFDGKLKLFSLFFVHLLVVHCVACVYISWPFVIYPGCTHSHKTKQ